MRGGRTIDEVLYEEKRRFDWIRGTTGMTGVRWAATHARSAQRLAHVFREHGVVVPGQPTRRYGAAVARFLAALP